MILDSRDKLRAIQRSLETVIIPAIPPEAGQACEQARFVAMHCAAMLEQVSWEYAMEAAEAGHFAALCRALGAAADDTLVARAEGLAAMRPTSQEIARGIVHDLRARADELLKAALQSGDPAKVEAAGRAVLAAARRHEVRAGAWVQDASYEGSDAPRMTIAESLDADHVEQKLQAQGT